MSEQSEYDQKSFEEAWNRVGRTRDGRTVYLHLQKIVEAIATDTDSGALRENLGRRKLAAEIRAAMSEGVRAQDPSINERPTVYTFAKPVSVASPRPRGAGRRVADWPPGTPADAPGPGNTG
jgi:hypothetical protein